ncbi:hypothetical protein GCM10022382_20290 [Microbacterium invictum]
MQDDAYIDEEPSDLDLVTRWARTPSAVTADEGSLPTALAVAVQELRAQTPGATFRLVAFHTLVDGAETARQGSVASSTLDALEVLSIVTSRISSTGVHVVAHTAVLHRAA